jgi:hypothetical protein
MDHLKEIIGIYQSVLENFTNLTEYESLQIAVQIHRNITIAKGLGINTPGPAFLEKIAMELGADQYNLTIKNALLGISSEIYNSNK